MSRQVRGPTARPRKNNLAIRLDTGPETGVDTGSLHNHGPGADQPSSPEVISDPKESTMHTGSVVVDPDSDCMGHSEHERVSSSAAVRLDG